MDSLPNRSAIKQLFADMWRDKNYKATFKNALDSSVEFSPLLSKVAVAVNTHLGGSMGMRSTRKQLQGLLHYVCGNLELRINSSSSVPSTYFLPLCSYIGSGKSIYYKFLKKIMDKVQEHTAVLDRQIFDVKYSNAEQKEQGQEDGKKSKIMFQSRQLVHGPGSKEG